MASVVYDSAQRSPVFWEELVALWQYRDLIRQLVSRDIKVRYKRSVLGVAWTMLNPLLMMGVLTVVFSHLFRASVPNFPVYLLAGTLLWNLFAQSSTNAMQQLVWGGALMTRIYIPRTVFAVAAVGTGIVNLLFALVPLGLIMILTGARFTLALFFLPISIFLAACFTLGVALILSSLVVIFADILDIYQVILSAWYFLTPVLYPAEIIPVKYRPFLLLNPMYHLVEIFRIPIYSGTLPPQQHIVGALVAAATTLLAGWMIFTFRVEKIIYEL